MKRLERDILELKLMVRAMVAIVTALALGQAVDIADVIPGY